MTEPNSASMPKVTTQKRKSRAINPCKWAAKILEKSTLLLYGEPRPNLYRYVPHQAKYVPFDIPNAKALTGWTPLIRKALGFTPPASSWIPLQEELMDQADRVHKISNRLFFSNGALSLESGGLVPIPVSQRYFNLTSIKTPYDPDADCPLWDQWLQERCPDYLALIQEFFGYILAPKNHYRKFFILHGPARTGKTTLINVVRMVLGSENVSGSGLNKLSQDFGPIETLGKMVNLSTEWARTGRRIDEGILKGFVSGDFMEMARKFQTSIHAVPTAKLVFAMNELPHFSDKSDGLSDRMVLIPFELPIEKTIPGFEAKFQDELPGILNWAIAGYKRLKANGVFSITDAMIQKHHQYWVEQSSARMFLHEMTDFTNEGFISRNDLFEGYLAWCRRFGERNPLGRGSFFREVRQVYPDAVELKPTINSRSVRVFRGIAYDLFGG